jgi:hypothetical protein
VFGCFWQVIANARVPIIKFVETRSNIPFDIRCAEKYLLKYRHPLPIVGLSSYSKLDIMFNGNALGSNLGIVDSCSFDVANGPEAADFIKVVCDKVQSVQFVCV